MGNLKRMLQRNLFLHFYVFAIIMANALFFGLSVRLSVYVSIRFSVNLVYGFQWNLSQIFVTWVTRAERVFSFRGQSSRSSGFCLWNIYERVISVFNGGISMKLATNSLCHGMNWNGGQGQTSKVKDVVSLWLMKWFNETLVSISVRVQVSKCAYSGDRYFDDVASNLTGISLDVFSGVCLFVNTISSERVNIWWWNLGVGTMYKNLGPVQMSGS